MRLLFTRLSWLRSGWPALRRDNWNGLSAGFGQAKSGFRKARLAIELIRSKDATVWVHWVKAWLY